MLLIGSRTLACLHISLSLIIEEHKTKNSIYFEAALGFGNEP